MSLISYRRAVVRSLAEERFTVSEISDILGVTYNTIHSDFRVLGLECERTDLERYWAEAPRIIEFADMGKTKTEIANKVGVDASVVARLAGELGVSIRKQGKTHGRVSTYHSGCECGPCHAVGHNYHKRQRLERFRRAIPEHVHGTYSGYSNWGCKCYQCRVASKRRSIEYTRLPVEPVNLYREWTPEEEQALRDYSLTARELAIKLRRTVHGVNHRRRRLKRLEVESN